MNENLPDAPGEYNVSIEGIMTCAPIFLTFDGEKWEIPTCYLNVDGTERKIYWYPNR